MQRTNSFTLLEAVVVLGIISLFILIGTPFLHVKQQPNQWLSTFDGLWQSARINAQREQRSIYFNFEENGLIIQNKQQQQRIKYPQGYTKSQQQIVEIKPNGYVSPTSVHLSNGQQTISLIFNLGGGDYRVSQKETACLYFGRSNAGN